MSQLPDNEPECQTDSECPTIELVVRARPRDIGAFAVRRTLPSMQRRMVGPFIFFDHMGPAELEPGTGMNVRPHPHISLATVTYLFDGEIFHRDSLGSAVAIQPGAVNWMTAGRGITHSERSSEERKKSGGRIHGIQAWVALPAAHEETEPAFFHHEAASIPSVPHEGGTLRVIAGKAYGVTSPVEVLSPMFYVDAKLDAGAKLALPTDYPERAAYVVEGRVKCGPEELEEGALAVFKEGMQPVLEALEPSRVMLLGGEPVGPRHIYWNFVSSSKDRIEQAKSDWKEGRFPKVPGDEIEFVPLPEV